MKCIRTGNNNTMKYAPRKTFFYHSVISSLKTLVLCKEFLRKCELWRQCVTTRNVMTDVYDAYVWKEFRHLDNQPYLVYPSNFCLSLNIDWFNPFKEAPYSAGGIYLTVQNLPRTERYKMENIILVGIMPGPQEPKKKYHFFPEASSG